MKIPIYKPFLPKKSLRYVYDSLKSGWISSLGKYKNLCEEKLKEKFEYKYVLLTNNGTSSTYLVSKSIKFKYPYIKNIIVPNSVYCAAWNSFLYDKEFNLIPWFVNEETWNIDLTNFKHIDDTAVLLVHNLGNIINVPKLKREFPKIIFVEDNCEGIYGKYEKYYSGTKSKVSSLSFFANKNITCGEGGAFCTDDEELYNYANLVHGQGQSSKKYIHSVLGNNFRMTNVQAAILYGQLEIFDEIMERKKEIFNYYNKEFSNIENIRTQKVEKNCSHSYWMYGIRIIGNSCYEDVEKYFNEVGIETRPMFYPIHYHEHLKYLKKEDDPIPEILSRECFMIPSYPELKKEELKHIVKTVNDYCKGVV